MLLINRHEDGQNISRRTGAASFSFEPKPEGTEKYDVSVSDMAALSRADEIASVLEWLFPVVLSGKTQRSSAMPLQRTLSGLLDAF